MQMPMNANKTLLTAAMVMSLFATMSCTNTTGTKDNNKPETSINREARQAEGTDELIRQRYDGCRILDHDYDNGYLEVKIVHDGTEKVALFDGSSRWVRTLWETKRERLPERVIEAIGQEGLAYEDIDDNDNKVVDSPGGLLYAVQARRHNDDFIFLVSPDGKIMSTLTADEWNDGRTYDTPPQQAGGQQQAGQPAGKAGARQPRRGQPTHRQWNGTPRLQPPRRDCKPWIRRRRGPFRRGRRRMGLPSQHMTCPGLQQQRQPKNLQHG